MNHSHPASVHRVVIALGANLGEPIQQLADARATLQTWTHPGGSFVASRLYLSQPLDCPAGSPAFYNAAVAFDFFGDASSLHQRTRKLEREFGRAQSSPRHSPRVLDLDLLLFGDQRIATPMLTIPHPRILERRFVLDPLCEVWPEESIPALQHRRSTLIALSQQLPQTIETLDLDWSRGTARTPSDR